MYKRAKQTRGFRRYQYDVLAAASSAAVFSDCLAAAAAAASASVGTWQEGR
jgi:hypothetical protein